jgi:hypothetical protein
MKCVNSYELSSHNELLAAESFFEKPLVAQPLNKFIIFYGTRKLFNVFTRSCHWFPSCSQMRLVHAIPSSHLRSILIRSILIPYTVGSTPWTGDQPVATPLPTRRTTQPQNKRTQIFMPRVGFEPTIPAFERAETVHALDREGTVIGKL